MSNDTIKKMIDDLRVKCPYASSGNVCLRAGTCNCICAAGQSREPEEAADAT